MPNGTPKHAVLFAIVLFTAYFGTRVFADDAGAKASPPAKGEQTGASPVERFKTIIEGLSLSDDQKLKAGVLFDAARDELKKLDGKADSSAVKQKSKAIFDKLRKDIGELLTNEQKLEVIKKMMPPGPTAIIERIKEQLSSPAAKLSDEQKQKAFAILDEAKKKLEDIRTEAQSGGKDIPARMNAVLKEMKEKLSKVLGSGSQGTAPKSEGAKKSE